ncbi:hypothetical protein BDR22DRAFT_893758 [Usnea florida]
MTNSIGVFLWLVGNLVYNPAYAVLVFEREHAHQQQSDLPQASIFIQHDALCPIPATDQEPRYDTRACPMDRGRKNVKPVTRSSLADALDNLFLSNMVLMFPEMNSPFTSTYHQALALLF